MRGTRNATIVPHGEHLQIEPSVVEFTNIHPNMKYIQTLVVKNLSSFVKRIRCEPPVTEEFTLISENRTALAPGLAMTIDVEFLTRRSGDYADRIVLKAEDFNLEIPLSAKAPCATITFDTKVSFGMVMAKRAHTKMLKFRNLGTEPGGVEITPPNRMLKLTPASFVIFPGSSQDVKLELMSEVPCALQEQVQVKLEGQSTMAPITRTIDIHGTLLDQKLHVFMDDAEVTSLDFGNIYQGQTKTLRVMLVNDGPTSCAFNAHVADEDESGSKSAASSPPEMVVKSATPLTVTPFTGHVPAFGKIPMEFRFAPEIMPERKGFVNNRQPEMKARTYTYSGNISSEDLNNTMALRLTGRAVVPALKVSPDTLDFGECAVNQRRDIVLRLTNSALPQMNPPATLDFSIPRVPHMEINPMKGRLAPQQNQNVIISFTPKALGRHNQDLVIKYCNELYSHRMSMYAAAPVIGEKKVAVKGLEKTGRNFDPEHSFVQPDSTKLVVPKVQNVKSLTKIMKSKTQDGDSMDALRSIMEDLPEPTPYSLTPAAMQEHVRNKQQYNRVLKDMRVTRKLEARKEEMQRYNEMLADLNYDINRGMIPGSGLKSPRLTLDEVEPDTLTLGEEDTGAGGVTGHRYQHDENKLIKKKFKGAATSPAEINECGRALANEQLGLISVGPAQLDFGTLYVKSQSVKSFSVYNDLPHAILVSLQFAEEESSISCKHASQVVPSAHAAGFDIVVYSAERQNIQKAVGYLINGIHQYKLWIKAEIVPVQIRLSRHEMNFRFTEESLEGTLTETVTLTNDGNAPACFTWQGMNSNFSVNPSTGIIARQGGSHPVEITFTPPGNADTKDLYLTLKTVDGDDQMLHVSGQAPEASCSFSRNRLDLTSIPVGLRQDKVVTVLNTGRNVAVFQVESLPDGVTVSQMRGRIPPEGRLELEVHVLMVRQAVLEGVISLNIRGGRPIRLPITASAVVPTIEILEDEIEFGELFLGVDEVLPITLRNVSAVEGTLYVNLQPHPAFTLSLLEGEGGEGDTDDSSYLQAIPLHAYLAGIGGSADVGAASAAKQGGKLPDSGHSGAQSPVNEDEDEESHSQIYKIMVPADRTLGLQLTCKPEVLGLVQYEFPIVEAGAVGKSEGLRRIVRAEALRPRMVCHNIIDFKTKVVASGIQAVPSVEDLMLGNTDDWPLEWKIDVEPLKKYMGAFNLEPSSGILAPGQEFPVRASFTPLEAIEYRQSLNVYISPPRPADEAPPQDGQPIETLPPDESKPYQQLKLRGQGTEPKLTFDRRDIVLPIVPLGIRSRCLFYIINEGYESLEVKYRLPTDTIRIPLDMSFPEGYQLGITKPRIPVEVYFQSAKPISFCAKIEFLDNEGNSYKLPVCGTTDNSVLTCHQYLTQYSRDFYTVEGDPVTLREKEDTNAGDGNGPAPSVKTGSVSHQSLGGYGGQDMTQIDFLVRWMNGTVLKNPIDHFPQDLIAQSGRPLSDMIEFLSGKPVSLKGQGGGGGGGIGGNAVRLDATASNFKGDKGGKQKSKDMNKIQHLLNQYEILLNHLKQNGAYLSSVRPEHFLSNDHYWRWHQSVNTGATRRQTEKSFYAKSIDAWLSCILQTVKIFLLNRTTIRLFRTLPGMSEGMDQPVAPPTPGNAAVPPNAAGSIMDAETIEKKQVCPELVAAIDPKGLGATDSNVYSTAESILLRWLNFHYWRANKDNKYPPRHIFYFDQDLDDSIVLAMVIKSHVPNCAAVENLKYPCQTFDHYEENAMHIISALQEIGLPFPIQTSDIATPQPKDMLLFVFFLFQNLQHYVPKTSIVFSTMLGVNLTKHIELTNPSRKAITYTASLQGSSDFTIKEDTIRIEPRTSASFPVEFQSRFSRQVDGRITFTSRRQGNTHAAAMVFKLQSECTGRRPRKTETVSAVLYEVGTVDIDLENPFSEDADFQVNLREMTLCDADKNPIFAKRCENIEPFHLSQNRVRVKANGTSKLTVSFLPFEAPAYFVAYLGFFDTRAGEFYYELLGESSPPSPLENLKINVKAGDFGFKEIMFPHCNVQMQRARSFLENRGVSVKQTLPDSVVYDVKLSSPYYTAPKQVTVVNSLSRQPVDKARGGAGGGQAAADRKLSLEPSGSKGGASVPAPGHNAQLRLEFRPKEPGVYPCTVTLTSDVDIRIYQMEGIGTAPNTYCSLTFHTQARKHITQEIPIVNSTDRDWIIKPNFAQTGHEFDGPREFTAKKRQANGQANVSCYPLTFKPDWICDVKGQLLLQNTGTQETYEYDIQGIAEEPLAEEHVIIECEAREKASHRFVVRNYSSQPAAFEVESDLVHISGPSSVPVEGRGQADYELVFQPLQTGTTTGCIMFRDLASGHFTWYTVQLKTLPPKPQQVLTLTCVVRQAVAVDIQLVNPLDDVVVFEVDKTGDGLLGESEFFLAPNEIATYELVFSPLLPSRKQGYAAFFNDLVGEFWYDLQLIAEPAPPEELPPLECELGRSTQVQVKIENPTGQEVQLKHRSTNKINFKVLQQRIVVPPVESTTVTIEYSPASLNTVEDAQIFFEHPIVGQWAYKVQGQGLPPAEPRKVQVVAQVGRPTSSTITFKNPFLESVSALILLESRSERGVFSLLNKKAKVSIGPLTTTQIPFSFCPPSMSQHMAELAVTVAKHGQQSLTWTYQIQGVAEAPTDSTLHSFQVQARENLEQYYLLTLAGLEASDRDTDALSCELEVPSQYQALVNRCFDIVLAESPDPAQQPKDKAQASVHVRFAPLKPFVAQCNLVISRAAGGRWRFDMKLEATEPEVDDTISIQSPLNKPASVAFRLCNHTSAYSEFDAFFDAESAYEFTVQPTSGVLEPQGTSGTTFVITYKPTEYGKPVQGKLIIQTEDVYWSYAVRGTHPKYTAPVADKPSIGTRLGRDVQLQMANANQLRRKKNFIRENMDKAEKKKKGPDAAI